MSFPACDTFFLDAFAFRQFDGGPQAQLDISKEAFVDAVHKLFQEANFQAFTGIHMNRLLQDIVYQKLLLLQCNLT